MPASESFKFHILSCLYSILISNRPEMKVGPFEKIGLVRRKEVSQPCKRRRGNELEPLLVQTLLSQRHRRVSWYIQLTTVSRDSVESEGMPVHFRVTSPPATPVWNSFWWAILEIRPESQYPPKKGISSLSAGSLSKHFPALQKDVDISPPFPRHWNYLQFLNLSLLYIINQSINQALLLPG